MQVALAHCHARLFQSPRFSADVTVPASLESSARTTPSVLLVEEYDALAVALTSALKRFAPQHRTRVVGSLNGADSAVSEIHPPLIVIDFDPPHPNIIGFLNRTRATHPETRVLVIASGLSPDFVAQRYGPNAVHFIPKPFELADFGAAVQALLGPWTQAGTGGSRGTLRDLNLRDLIPLACVNDTTTTFDVTAPGGRRGEILILDGHICHASTPGSIGIDGLIEIMRWKDAHVVEAERVGAGPRTIQGPWLPIFLDALAAAKSAADELRISPPPVTVDDEPKTPKTGKKIIVIDDTEMLLIFVEDSLSIADPNLQIVTASSGSEGIKQTEAIIPDLVLLDYSLSDSRGDQVCERLLRNENTAAIPIIMMSGHVPEMMATATRYPNVVATIAKPFVSEALVQLVQKTLADSSARSVPSGKTKATPIPVEPAETVSHEVKPARTGNGKKPVKKGSPSKAKSVQVPKPPPEFAAPDLDPPAPARKIDLTEASLVETPLQPLGARKQTTPKHATVVLSWGMEVISVQFTPSFQIDTIRAKPSMSMLSLTLQQAPATGENRGGAFEPGPVELDVDGQIETMRVRPSRARDYSIHTRNGFAINDVNLLNESERIQFIAGSAAPMILQLVALFKVDRVELSDRFELAHLVLYSVGNQVRITLDSHLRLTAGQEFETIGVQLDESGRVVELVLKPIAPSVKKEDNKAEF